MMSSDNTRRLTTEFYNDFLSGDDLALLGKKYLTEETVWEIFLPENVPYGGVYRGDKQIMDYFGVVFQNMTLSNFEVKNIVVENDVAAVFVTEHGDIASTSRSITMDSIHFIKFKDEKIIYFREYCDTHAMAVAFTPDK